jgi:hypothetical protein
LLEDTNSRFYALCKAAGKKELAILKKMARGKARVTHKPRRVRLFSLFSLLSLSPCSFLQSADALLLHAARPPYYFWQDNQG